MCTGRQNYNRPLTLLTRIAYRTGKHRWLNQALEGRLGRLVDDILEVAVETGDPIGSTLAKLMERGGPPELVNNVANLCEDTRYQLSVPLQELAMVTARRRLEFYRQEWPQPDVEQSLELARLTCNLGNRLHDLGHYEEACNCGKQSVQICEDVIAGAPSEDARHDLALYLITFGSSLREMGHLEDAADIASRSVDLFQELGLQDSVDYASALLLKGSAHADMGEFDEALQNSERAVGLP